VKKIQVTLLAALCMLVSPVFAQGPQAGSDTPPPTASNDTNQVRRINLFDSESAYWVNKGFNDTMFGVNTGSFNEAHHEERQKRNDDKINKITKKNAPTEIIYEGKVQDPVTPLKIEGRKVELPH
jgi:hypothetical protein